MLRRFPAADLHPLVFLTELVLFQLELLYSAKTSTVNTIDLGPCSEKQTVLLDVVNIYFLLSSREML